MARLISARLPIPPLRIRSADGVWLTDEHGRRYIDASSGLINCNIGHGNRAVALAMSEAASNGAFVAPGAMLHENQFAYASELLSAVGRKNDSVIFRSTGTEALEGAVALAKAVHRDRGNGERTAVLTLRVSYHGNSAMLLALSGLVRRRTVDLDELGLRPTLGGFDPRWFDPFDDLETHLARPDVAAVLVEPITGTSGGAVEPPHNFMPHLRQLCSRHGVILIHDEVLTGLGRVGTPLASEVWKGANADITVVAKGLGAGYYPIAAMIVSREIAEPIESGRLPTPLMGTMSSSPMLAAVGRTVLRETLATKYWQDMRGHGTRLEYGLREAVDNGGTFKELRGRGYLWAFEVPTGEQQRVLAEFRSEGLIAYPFNGFGPAAVGEGFIIAPPFIASADEIDEILRIVKVVGGKQ